MVNRLIKEPAGDPYVVTMEQVKQCFGALGISDISHVRRLEIEPGRITLERMRLDDSGVAYPVPGYNEVATVTVTIAVVG